MKLNEMFLCLGLLSLGMSLSSPFTFSQTGSSAPTQVRQFRKTHEREIVSEFVELLAIPNVASDTVNIKRNANLIVEMLRKRGVQARLLESAPAPPAVYGELITPGVTRTIVFYAHYDGQPVDPSRWVGSEPWNPVLRTGALEAGGSIIPFPRPGESFGPDWRIYARSASDDKAPIVGLMAALDALRASKTLPSSNIKFFFEGEEEASSPHLREIVRKYAGTLGGDVWIICDGPVHQSGRKQLYFGARGIVTTEVTVYGANRPLHSGHYGNWAPNPAMMLAKLLAGMKEESGRVTIDGFYEDAEPLGPEERGALKDAAFYDEELSRQLGLRAVEGAGKSLAELITLPSLNVDGLSSAYIGAQARTIIPTTATVAIDLRLVKGQRPETQVARLVAHIRKQGYFVAAREPTEQERLEHAKIARVRTREGGGYSAYRVGMDLPIARAILAAMQSVTDQPVIRLPTLGGSAPLYIFEE